MKQSIGSVWGKWDFHVHTPYSILNNQFGFNPFESEKNYHEEEFDQYVIQLFSKAVEKEIVAIGITDYFILDGYKRIKEQYLGSPEKMEMCFPDEELRNKVQQIYVFPNIEFRLNTFIGEKAHAVNYHVIFSDDVPIVELEENFLHRLQFEINPGQTLPLTKNSIETYGNSLICDKHETGSPFYVGIKNITVNYVEILNQLNSDSLRNKHLIAIPVDEDLSIVSWNGRDYTTRKNLYKQCHCYLTSNVKTRKWALAEGEEENRIAEFGSIKPCIWGSDAHSIDDLFSPAEDRFCWIKAIPSFEGLLQILYEPADRVRIQKERPNMKDPHHIINRILFESEEFPKKPIVFNESLTCIIGGKSTGKSMLLRHIAYSIDKEYAKKQEATVNVGKPVPFNPAQATVFWQDDSTESKEFVYIPQTFLNRTIDDPEQETSIDSFIKEVLLQNETIKESYDTLNYNLQKIKGEIFVQLKIYKDESDRLKELEKEIKQEGGSESFKSTLKKLQGERNRIAGEVKITEEDINRYTELKENIRNYETQIQVYTEDEEYISNIPDPIVFFDEDDLFYSSTEPIENCSLAKKNPALFASLIPFFQEINSYLAERWSSKKETICNVIKTKISEINSDLTSITPEFEALQKKVEQNERLQQLAKMITTEEEKLQIAKKREEERESIIQTIHELKCTIKRAHSRYYEAYSDYCNAINQFDDFEGTDLNFRAEAKWKVEAFSALIEDAFDKRYFVTFNSKYAQKIEEPSEETVKHDLLLDIWDALTEDSKHGELHLKGSFKLDTILPRLFDDWYNVHYIVTSGNDDTVSQMSPGKKALVLLELLINLKESQSPILIDQPEDDLDNRSIYTELSKFIKEKKIKRQIIVVTHNANIVLGADAEQVIVANQNGKDTPNNDGLKFEYRSGALEENDKELNDDGSECIGILSKKGIQTQICDILEGGRSAFELRKNKYSVNRNI